MTVQQTAVHRGLRVEWRARWVEWQPYMLSAVAVAIVVAYLFPIYWMYISGLKLSSEIFARPPTFVPAEPTLESYRWIFERENVLVYLRNSLIIATATTALTLVLGCLGAYALSRLRSRLVDVAIVFILIMQTFPESLLATPMFVIFRGLDLLNTLTAVVLATTSKTLAFALIILRPIFRQVPFELEEAAMVDGCNRITAFLFIVLPVARSGIIVVGALAFLMAYGEFVYPASLLTRQELQPATVGLYSFVGAEYADWHHVMAFASVFVTPAVILFLLLQRKIVAGLTAGALK